MFFIIIIISISIIYTLLEFCYTHLKSHYYDYVFFHIYVNVYRRVSSNSPNSSYHGILQRW